MSFIRDLGDEDSSAKFDEHLDLKDWSLPQV